MLGDDESSTTTVVRRVGGPAATSSAATLDAGGLYGDSAAGVVDIKVKAASTTAAPPGPFGEPQQSESTATGSGFVVDAQGRIITAAHVAGEARSITVTFQDGTARTATVLGKDDATDIALLKVDPKGMTLQPLKLGSSAALEVGDAVAVIGSPFGFAGSISTGIVSGLDRTITAPNGFTVSHAVQTDAAMNPGNSGGPVLAANGTVVGIADQIATSGSADQSSGVGFAVPVDLVADELDSLIAGKPVTHAYAGLSTAEASGGTTTGALVGEVVSGGPAERAGITTGDVITAIDGTAVKGSGDLVAAIAAHAPGDTVNVTIRRGDETRKVTVQLGTQPATAGATGG